LPILRLLRSVPWAAARFTGTVRDESGGALQGVTVTVSSLDLAGPPDASTDDSGVYRISGLRPGTYKVTFTLKGFATVSREGIDVEGPKIVPVSTHMRIANIEGDRVDVAIESPVIDVENTTRLFAMTQDTLKLFPTPPYYYSLGQLVPGVSSVSILGGPNLRDVGDATGNLFSSALFVHGGRPEDQRVLVNGLAHGAIITPAISNFIPNAGAVHEIVFVTSGSGADQQTGGVLVNYVPIDGGNRLKGSVFSTAATARMQDRNLTQDLRDQGAGASPNTLDKTREFNSGFGGPVVRDYLWFYGSVRSLIAQVKTDQYYNLNAFLPNVYRFAPDLSRQARSRDGRWTDYYGRLTRQLNARNKAAFTFSDQDRCECLNGVSPTRTPEAAFNDRNTVQRSLQAEYRFTPSSKLMFEFIGQKRDVEGESCRSLRRRAASALRSSRSIGA
jgi:carboxypeptidase family protein